MTDSKMSRIAVVCAVHFPSWGELLAVDPVEQIYGQMSLDLFTSLARAGVDVYAVFAMGGISAAYTHKIDELSGRYEHFYVVLVPDIQAGEFTRLLQHGIRMAAQSTAAVIGILSPDNSQTVDWLVCADPILQGTCDIVMPSRYGSPSFESAHDGSLLGRERRYNQELQETLNDHQLLRPKNSPFDFWSRTLFVANQRRILHPFLAGWQYTGSMRSGDPMYSWLGGMVLPFGLSLRDGRRIEAIDVPFANDPRLNQLERVARLAYIRDDMTFDAGALLSALLWGEREGLPELHWVLGDL